VSRPTILFVGINYRYINPTNPQLPAVVARVFDAHFYGPGFVAADVLERGLERFVESIGGVDLIFATKDFSGGTDPARLARFTKRYVVMLNGGEVTPDVSRDISTFLQKNRERVVCLITDVDPHAVGQSMLDNFKRHGAYYLGWGAQFLDTLGEADWVAVEEYMQKKLRTGRPLGLLDAFARREDDRFISVGFYVSEPEFFWGPLRNRPYDVAVPGSRYARRQAFAGAVRAIEGVRVPGSAYSLACRIADRLGLRPFASFYALSLYNLTFQRALSLSKSCITDGGANNYPVRKFFEIPAAGAVLLAAPAVGMADLGFEHGVNYLSVRTTAEAVSAVDDIRTHPDRYEGIAAAGRSLVLRRHSLSARAEQLAQAVAAILAGTFAGSRWTAGEFVCRSSGERRAHAIS
jgi:Glycosyl transferases group 1